LECIGEDQPRGCWIIQKNSSGEKVSIRNLKWPGYFGYHEACTSTYGGVYIGDGMSNADLPFMI
jgi:radial spoke head protein 9